MASPLSPADLAVVHETLQEIRDMPPPRDRRPLGCLMILAGVALLAGLPALGRLVDIATGLGTAGLLAGGGLLALGVILWMTAGGFAHGHYVAAAEAALRQLEQWSPRDGDRELALRAATLLLTHAVSDYGPTSMSSFDRGEAEGRLATKMPLVLAVQDVLVKEDATYPIFGTRGTQHEEDSDDPPS